MTAFDELRAIGILDWGTIRVAYLRGWIAASEVSAIALEQVLSDTRPSIELTELAAEPKPYQVLDLLDSLAAEADVSTATANRRLLLGSLLDLRRLQRRGTITDEESLDQLEDLYAQFDYPDLLRYCSRYNFRPKGAAQDGEDDDSPLAALSAAIDSLEHELLPIERRPAVDP